MSVVGTFVLAEGLVCEVCYRLRGNGTDSKGFLFGSGFLGLLQRFGALTTVLRWFKIVPACSTMLWAGALRRASALTLLHFTARVSGEQWEMMWYSSHGASGAQAHIGSAACLEPLAAVSRGAGHTARSEWDHCGCVCQGSASSNSVIIIEAHNTRKKTREQWVGLQLLGMQCVCISRSTYLHPHAVCLAGNSAFDVIFFHQASS